MLRLLAIPSRYGIVADALQPSDFGQNAASARFLFGALEKMSTIAIIPARYASTRLPGKPLLDETGKTLIQHVVENAKQSASLDRIIVATDDDRIFKAVETFGGEAVMTGQSCRTGTDRLAEAAQKLQLAPDDFIVNVQGDEPDIPPACIDELVNLITSSQAPMATLATHLPNDQAGDPNKVKVVLNGSSNALYFSRAKIPHPRDEEEVTYLLHLGIYAYRAEFLQQFTTLPSTPAEQVEKLEQLRALEHGYKIAVAVVEYEGGGIDTPEDYAEFVDKIKNFPK